MTVAPPPADLGVGELHEVTVRFWQQRRAMFDNQCVAIINVVNLFTAAASSSSRNRWWSVMREGGEVGGGEAK